MSISGLRFCVLSKDVDQNRRRPTTRPKPVEVQRQEEDDALFAAFDFTSGSGGAASGASLLDAVLNGHIEEAKELIKDGADVNAEDQHGTEHIFNYI